MRAARDVATRVVRVAVLDVLAVHHAARENALTEAGRESFELRFDAVQAFSTLKLDYERAVALADLARALQNVPGREEQAQAQCTEAKAIAERLGATALRVAAENMTVRV